MPPQFKGGSELMKSMGKIIKVETVQPIQINSHELASMDTMKKTYE